ncbi:hypothetical protein D3C78_753300 [compost metagenome]
MRKVKLALRGQAHRAGGAVDQANTKPCLQRCQAFAHCRGGYAEFACRGREAALGGEQVEKRKVKCLIHGWLEATMGSYRMCPMIDNLK